jgi:hypothetical protein
VTGYVPAWSAFLIGFLVFFLIGIPLGVWLGFGLGAEHEEREAAAEAEAEAAAAAVRSWRPTEQQSRMMHPTNRDRRRAEVAHEAWTAHVEQAQAVANPRGYFDLSGLPDYVAGSDAWFRNQREEPDTRTDTAWTRDMAADMDRWLAGLLNAHPHTEDL